MSSGNVTGPGSGGVPYQHQGQGSQREQNPVTELFTRLGTPPQSSNAIPESKGSLSSIDEKIHTALDIIAKQAPPQAQSANVPSTLYEEKAKQWRAFWIQNNISGRSDDALEHYLKVAAARYYSIVNAELLAASPIDSHFPSLFQANMDAWNLKMETERSYEEAKKNGTLTFYSGKDEPATYDPSVFLSPTLPFSLDKEGVDFVNAWEIQFPEGSITQEINLINRQQLIQKTKDLLARLYEKNPELNKPEYKPALELIALMIVTSTVEEMRVHLTDYLDFMDTMIAIRDSEEVQSDPSAYHRYIDILTNPKFSAKERLEVMAKFSISKLSDAGLSSSVLHELRRHFLNALHWDLNLIGILPNEVTPEKSAQIEMRFQEAKTNFENTRSRVGESVAELDKKLSDATARRNAVFKLSLNTQGEARLQHKTVFQQAVAEITTLKAQIKAEMEPYKSVVKDYFDRLEEVHYLTDLSAQREFFQQKVQEARSQLANHPKVKKLQNELRDLQQQHSSYVENLPQIKEMRATIYRDKNRLANEPNNLDNAPKYRALADQIKIAEKELFEIMEFDAGAAALQTQINDALQELENVYQTDPEAYFLKEQHLFYNGLLSDASW